jgi:3'(2'), 5'-bisphosphate nucleotidase
LSACLSAARNAGTIIRSVYDQGKNVSSIVDKRETEKAALWVDPQTEADVRAQNMIISSLHSAFPTLKIVGEEDDTAAAASFPLTLDTFSPTTTLVDAEPLFAHIPASVASLTMDKITVWVDPLDGTREYTLGHVDNVTTLIGISYCGHALAGVVHAPFLNQTLYGAVGVGVVGEGGAEPRASFWQSPEDALAGLALGGADAGAAADARTPNVPTVPEADLTVVTSRNHMTDTLRSVLEGLKVGRVLQVGGAGSKGVRLLTGAAHAYVFPQGGTKRWDTCAVHALVSALGGTVTDAYGGPLRYDCAHADAENVDGVLATLGCPHERLVLPRGTAIYKGEGKL